MAPTLPSLSPGPLALLSLHGAQRYKTVESLRYTRETPVCMGICELKAQGTVMSSSTVKTLTGN